MSQTDDQTQSANAPTIADVLSKVNETLVVSQG